MNKASRNAAIAVVEGAPAFLPETSVLRRLPRAPRRKRPEAFHRAFEDRCLIYDCFWYGADGTVLLIGPPPHNLKDRLTTARYRALPSKKELVPRIRSSRSTAITELTQVPEKTNEIAVELEGETFVLPINRDFSQDLSGARILFAINKDNRLDWIYRWADWHARLHGTDCVIVFDNGSQSYGPKDIAERLSSVEGLSRIIVVPVPFKFGPLDHWVMAHHFWPRFLQISCVNIALRRFGMKAQGLINCDIDELVWAGGRSVYDCAHASPLGVARMRGRWIEAVRADGKEARDHLGFPYRRKGIRASLSPSKFVLDPSRDWLADLQVHPYLHRVHFAPRGARRHTADAMFFHFKGINTNWKEVRAIHQRVDPRQHAIDEDWEKAVARYRGTR